MHFTRKLFRTIGILSCLGMARMFGEYRHTGCDGFDFCRYTWRGKDWIIPTGPLDDC